ncbi:CD4-1 molecule isoform X2 [Hoplias malabaricus]|uniref:CD4-1 molecule isoform X2 n=1 Tax=Hoplias malabaricus TaxID=27720 RepID=UPI003462A4A5
MWVSSHGPKTQVEPKQNYFAQVGSSVTLHRKMDYSKGAYVRWFFESNGNNILLILKHPKQDMPKKEQLEEWKNRISLSTNYDLIISDLKESDFTDGHFRCEQQTSNDIQRAEYKLNRVRMPLSLTIPAGDELSLSCESDTVQIPTIQWDTPNNKTYTRQKKITEKVTAQYSGSWRCKDQTDPRQVQVSTTVIVIDLTPFPAELYSSISSRSPPLVLPCSLSSAVSLSELERVHLNQARWSFRPLNMSSEQEPYTLLTLSSSSWTHNQTSSQRILLSEKHLKGQDLSTSIPKLTASYRGTYTCQLEFKSGKIISSTLKLELLEVGSSVREKVTIREGDPVNLTCSLGHPTPPGITLKWKHPTTQARFQNHLHIPWAKVSDSGQWTCELTKDSTILTSARINLKIVKVIDAWVYLVSSGVLVFVLILIAVIIVCRKRQAVMYRRRKTRFCCCKNPQVKGFHKT